MYTGLYMNFSLDNNLLKQNFLVANIPYPDILTNMEQLYTRAMCMGLFNVQLLFLIG